MLFLYNLFIHFYHLGIRIASLSNSKAKRWIDGRKNLFAKLGTEMAECGQVIWFHAASLGEFEQGRPVIEAVKKKYPNYKILLTFYSPSGYEIRKNYKGADFVYYLPLDLKKNVRRFLDMVNPQFSIFIKYEFWINYMQELNNRKIPLYIISANFRSDQYFFKGYGSWFRKNLKNVDWFFVQNKESESLLTSIGYNNVSVSGDTRFDRVVQVARNPQKFEDIESFSNGNFTVLAGSTWSEDEKLLHQWYAQQNKNVKLIIAPHEIHEAHLKQIETLFGSYKASRLSNIKNSPASELDILIIDGMGFLSSLYQYCEVAYIGGGFGKGIHNILEAVTFGKPVIFGPNYQKFSEAVQLVKIGGAFAISDLSSLADILAKLSNQDADYEKCASICREFINTKAGATDIILNKLAKKFS
jgi:3-deoxy-D-manno-octulosonic-acid transferase